MVCKNTVFLIKPRKFLKNNMEVSEGIKASHNQKKKNPNHLIVRVLFFVPRTGVEPAHLSIYAPETYASTNSAIGALVIVPRTRVELACRNRHHPLKVACLPISPPGLEIGGKDTTFFNAVTTSRKIL